MKNAYFLMKENPTWEISKIIDKTKEKSDLEFYNKNQDEREKTDLETIDTAKKLGFSVIDRMIDPKTGELMKN
jgi:hypothetical protein